jgi:hypothetical protein
VAAATDQKAALLPAVMVAFLFATIAGCVFVWLLTAFEATAWRG